MTSTASGRLRLDAACRHIQDIGETNCRRWATRRPTRCGSSVTMVDLIRPIEFEDMLRLRRWCSGTSNRWCEMRVHIDGVRGRGLIRSEAFWININRETQGPARISDDFMEGLQRATDVNRLRWKSI
ncbi:MAG: thioesterase [Mycobacterium sp.]